MRGTTPPVDQRTRIPLTIVVGAPGAGTSTLVRHLLEQTTERRIAAVIPADEVIDASLISERNGARMVLRNGCVCVVADDDGAATLANLADAAERPEHVVFEASAAMTPRRLSGYGYMPGYYLDGMVVVVDAPGVCRCDHDEYSRDRLQQRLAGADLVLVNKMDLIDENDAARVQDVLDTVAPNCRVVLCEHSRIAPPLLLGAPLDPDPRAVVAEWTSTYMPSRSRGRPLPRPTRLRGGDRHRSWCLVTDKAIESREFRSWVQRLPTSILSGRGTVYLREEPQHRHTFHLLGSRWRLERGTPWGRDVPGTKLRLAGIAGQQTNGRGVDDAATLAGDVA
jgi:G3E family GTPase